MWGRWFTLSPTAASNRQGQLTWLHQTSDGVSSHLLPPSRLIHLCPINQGQPYCAAWARCGLAVQLSRAGAAKHSPWRSWSLLVIWAIDIDTNPCHCVSMNPVMVLSSSSNSDFTMATGNRTSSSQQATTFHSWVVFHLFIMLMLLHFSFSPIWPLHTCTLCGSFCRLGTWLAGPEGPGWHLSSLLSGRAASVYGLPVPNAEGHGSLQVSIFPPVLYCLDFIWFNFYEFWA